MSICVDFNGPDDPDPTWWLECQISYPVGANQVRTTIHSGHRSEPSQGYPDPMNRWVNDHPNGSAIRVRRDPSNPLSAVPATDYLPNGGPRTQYDLRFLLACLAACAGLLTLARRLRGRAIGRANPP